MKDEDGWIKKLVHDWCVSLVESGMTKKEAGEAMKQAIEMLTLQMGPPGPLDRTCPDTVPDSWL